MSELVVFGHQPSRIQTSFLECLNESFPGGPKNANEKMLKDVLTQFAKQGNKELDLSRSGLAFTRVSRKAWVALGARCLAAAPAPEQVETAPGVERIAPFRAASFTAG